MMNIDTKALKQSFGVQAMEIIASGIPIVGWNSKKQEGLCPFHNEKTASFKWNPKSNSFKCFGCGKSLDIIEYYMQFEGKTFFEAVEAIGGQIDREDYRHKESGYTRPIASVDGDMEKVRAYMLTRGISEATMAYVGLRQSKGNIMFEYRNLLGEVEMIKYRPARKVQKGENKCWSEKNGRPLLYGMHQIDTSKPVLICEGEIDRLAAIESGFYNAVSIPLGANNYGWIEENWAWLDSIEQFILWFDNDEAGKKGIREVVPRLGEAKCSIVNCSSSKDINVELFLKGKESVLKHIESAEPVPLAGVKSLADVEDFNIYDTEKIKSGIKGLDRWIGGFVLGTVNVLTGVNGSGKSTFVNQALVCEPINQGYKTFIFSGELTDPQLRAWIEYPLAGPNHIEEYKKGDNQPSSYKVSKDTKSRMREWYRDKLYVCEIEDITADKLLELMANVAKRYGVKNFVLDNLMMIDLECDSYGELKAQKEFVKRLKDFAVKFNAVVHLVAHPRKVEAPRRLTKNDVAGSGDITNLADYVIAVHRVTPAEKTPEVNRKGEEVKPGEYADCIIDLFKNRPLGHSDKAVKLMYHYPSKRFYGRNDTPNWPYNWSVPDWVAEADQLEIEL